MYSSDLDHFMRTEPDYLGAFPCDRLPNSNKPVYFLIVNTKPSGHEGEHWQLIYVKHNQAFFFCSLGRKFGPIIKKYLDRFDIVYYNKNKPQLCNEITCGGYAVFVAKMLCLGHKFKDLCKFFDVISKDDMFIRYFMWNYYKFKFE